MNVVGMEAVFLQAWVSELDKSKPVLWLFLQSNANGVVAHETEILKDVREFARGFESELDCLYRTHGSVVVNVI
jgi:hypothetical protein